MDPDFVDRGFTCETKKRFFVDDTGEQTVATLPQVEHNNNNNNNNHDDIYSAVIYRVAQKK